ncbi:unnamed protein product, partial [Mesorhabditis belari]|uniref:Uncharacterized protein n=1 Tax=Mesorhabditis belari TaxID=2138241 RepID=A0AAF3ER90_9BILA
MRMIHLISGYSIPTINKLDSINITMNGTTAASGNKKKHSSMVKNPNGIILYHLKFLFDGKMEFGSLTKASIEEEEEVEKEGNRLNPILRQAKLELHLHYQLEQEGQLGVHSLCGRIC